MRGRVLLALVGVAAAAYGGWMLLDDDLSDLVSAATWLVLGVLLHDFVLVPLVLVLGIVAIRAVPEAARGPAVTGFVVLGSVTLLAIPVLGQFGTSPGNPTLLDRNYAAGWMGLAGLTLVAVAVAVAVTVVVRERRRRS